MAPRPQSQDTAKPQPCPSPVQHGDLPCGQNRHRRLETPMVPQNLEVHHNFLIQIVIFRAIIPCNLLLSPSRYEISHIISRGFSMGWIHPGGCSGWIRRRSHSCTIVCWYWCIDGWWMRSAADSIWLEDSWNWRGNSQDTPIFTGKTHGFLYISPEINPFRDGNRLGVSNVSQARACRERPPSSLSPRRFLQHRRGIIPIAGWTENRYFQLSELWWNSATYILL